MHATPKLKLSRASILRRRGDFAQLKTEGRRLRGRALSFNWDLKSATVRQAAFVVPKKCGEAVMRNRIRRRLREIFRHAQHQMPPALRGVWIAHPACAGLSYDEMREDFYQLCRRAGLLAVEGGA